MSLGCQNIWLIASIWPWGSSVRGSFRSAGISWRISAQSSQPPPRLSAGAKQPQSSLRGGTIDLCKRPLNQQLHTSGDSGTPAIMSVKFNQETVQETIKETVTGQAVGQAAKGGKETLAHEVGAALTKGGGPNGYLAVRRSSQSSVLRCAG